MSLSSAWAQEKLQSENNFVPQIQKEVQLGNQEPLPSALNPKNYFALFNYSYLDLIIPSKYGFTAGIFSTEDESWELEFLRGNLSVPFLIKDLGSMSDDRISVIHRPLSSKTAFNFSYGLSFFSFTTHVGDKLLNRLSGGRFTSVDLINIQSLGFHLGLGHRWTFNENIILSIDWISWGQPLINLKKESSFLDYADNPEDRSEVESLIKVTSYFPRLSLLKVQFGMSF